MWGCGAATRRFERFCWLYWRGYQESDMMQNRGGQRGAKSLTLTCHREESRWRPAGSITWRATVRISTLINQAHHNLRPAMCSFLGKCVTDACVCN
jgi:hypothetical protein